LLFFLIFLYLPPSLLYLPSFPTRRSSDLSFSIISFIIAALFIAIAYFGTIWLRYEVYNLFDIRGPKFFQITFYLLMFLNAAAFRSEEHTSELQSRFDLVCRLLLEKKKKNL